MAGSPEPVATAPDACWPEPSEWNQTITETANAAPRSVEVIGLITPSSCCTHPEPDTFHEKGLALYPRMRNRILGGTLLRGHSGRYFYAEIAGATHCFLGAAPQHHAKNGFAFQGALREDFTAVILNNFLDHRQS